MLRKTLSLSAGLLWLLASGLGPLPAVAQDWQPELTDQMLYEHNCEVAFFSQVTERTVNQDQIVLAKVHCIDKRTFDAYRDSAFEPFEIHPCEEPDAKSC